MDSTSPGLLQRVFTWRWTAPEDQETFELDFAELERVWNEQRDDLRAELDADRDLEGPTPQLDMPYPGLGQRGGRYVDDREDVRKPPQLELLERCCPPSPTRLELETGFEAASPLRLAERIHWAFWHRGRPTGLSPADYAAQKELTVARSLTWSFFENCREMPGVPVPWREKFGDAAQVLGFLLWARRLGRWGMTLSGPQGCAVLDIGIATWWRYVQKLERAGYLIRLRRWKPGKVAPVALAANWYALGPRALDDLAALEDPKPVMRRARQRVRRQHRRAEGRRRGLDLLPGYSYPDVRTFARLSIAAWQAARVRDVKRWEDFQAGIPPIDFTTAARPSFVFLVDEDVQQLRPLASVDGPELELVDALDDLPCDLGSAAGADDGLEEEVVHVAAVDVREIATEAAFADVREDDAEPDARRAGPLQRLADLPENPLDLRRRRLRRVRHAHGGCVAPNGAPIIGPGRKSFEARCANSQPGGVGAVTGRDSRASVSAIPISPRIGVPEGEGKEFKDWPQASGARPPKPPPEHGSPPATASGPPGEPGSTAANVLSEVKDPRLRALCAQLGRIIGAIE